MYEESAGGGPLLSSAIYVMELLIWLFGPIRSCGGVRTAMGNGVEGQYILSGEMENGVLFTAQTVRWRRCRTARGSMGSRAGRSFRTIGRRAGQCSAGMARRRKRWNFPASMS